jgi:DNA polymerase-3 subunit epsilon
MVAGANDAEVWLGVCQRLAPLFAEVFKGFPAIGSLVFVDTETSGFGGSDIIELGAISIGRSKSDPLGVCMDYFWEMIDPGGARVSPFATRIHGITPDMLKRHGRPPKETYRRFAEWIEWLSPKNLVAHNAAFDRGMLEAAFLEHGVECRLPEFLCTMKMAKGLPTADRKLGTLARHFGCANRQAHRSITDAEVCAFIFAEMTIGSSIGSRADSR